METKGLILFGKHPAWSDHMFVTFDAEIGRHLKHVFYDHSVIPGLQGGDGDKRIPETWKFLISVKRQIFFMVSVPSRDSVGRSRFPLVVAYPLPSELHLEAASDQLNGLAHELHELLLGMLDDSLGENLNQWQAEVEQKAEAFKSQVDWSSVDSTSISGILPRDKLASLMTRLLDEHDALSLKSCSFVEGIGLFLSGLKQFKSSVPTLLVLDQENVPDSLFFASTEGATFNLKRRLYGNLTPLSVSAGNVLPKVDRLLKSSAAKPDEVLSVNDVPSLKLDENRKPSSRKPFFLAILFALVASILIGFLLSKTENDATFVVSEENSAQMDSFRKRWSSNAISYIEWVQPLSEYVTEQSIQIKEFGPVLENLKLDLNPFLAVKVAVPSMELAKNPSDQLLNTDSTDKLNKIYYNINQLKASLIAYHKQRFTNPFPEELIQAGYSLPKFVEVDFSQQPLRPEFGSQLVQKFDTCIRDHVALVELGSSIADLERLIVEPLHEVYPEHAGIIRNCVQQLIMNSKSLEQFEDQYSRLLKKVHYPEFIELEPLDIEALSVDAEWIDLPQQKPSLQTIETLMERLEVYQKEDASTQTIDLGKQELELPIQQPDITLNELPDSSLQAPEPFNDQPVVSEIQNHLETVPALLRHLETLTTGEETIDEQKLALVTEAFNGLNQSDVTVELKDSIRLAFDQHLQQLRLKDAEEDILLIYANLDNYLPKPINTSQDTAYAQIAAYWSRNNSTSDLELTEKNELEKLVVAAESPTVREFFKQLLDMSGREQLAAVARSKTNSPIEDIYEIHFNEDGSRLEITFTDKDLELIFLPLETKDGEIFVQQTPLSLKQFILLSNVCGMDTEYSLASQDSLWPRCFEVGVGQSFRALDQWQFRNGDVFTSLEPFSARTIPAHLNEPKEILRLSEHLGLRLLRPDECPDFVRFADSSAQVKVQMSIEDQKNIQASNTIESSVYADLITASMEQGVWSGGIDFDRRSPAESRFIDVVGGASELAYDGTDFYAFGGSWLYAPSDPLKYFKISKQDKMYIDLGIRFVAEVAASGNYNELVRRLALQFLNSED